jgi:hypothetical protein
MTKKQYHPDRARLIAALSVGDDDVMRHLTQCEECRIIFDLLEASCSDSLDIIVSPPEAVTQTSKAIARLVAGRRPSRKVTAITVFDSWDSRPALAMRDLTPDVERRLRFRAGPFTIELVANRRVVDWECVARVYDRGRISRKFLLQVGSKKLLPEAGDCFFWTSKRPPRCMKLLSGPLLIDLGRLKW